MSNSYIEAHQSCDEHVALSHIFRFLAQQWASANALRVLANQLGYWQTNWVIVCPRVLPVLCVIGQQQGIGQCLWAESLV